MWGPGEDKDFWEVYWMGRGQGRVPAISHCPDSLGSSEPFTVKTHLGLATGRQNISLLCYSPTSGLFWLVRFQIQSFRNKITEDIYQICHSQTAVDPEQGLYRLKILYSGADFNYKQH